MIYIPFSLQPAYENWGVPPIFNNHFGQMVPPQFQQIFQKRSRTSCQMMSLSMSKTSKQIRLISVRPALDP